MTDRIEAAVFLGFLLLGVFGVVSSTLVLLADYQ